MKVLRSPICDLRSPISDLRRPTSDLRPPTSDLRSPICDLRSPICDLRPPPRVFPARLSPELLEARVHDPEPLLGFSASARGVHQLRYFEDLPKKMIHA